MSNEHAFSTRITRLPSPFDAALGAEAAAPFTTFGPEVADLIRGTAGCSPYLKGLIARQGDWLMGALEAGPEAALAGLLRDMSDGAAAVGLRLREAKARAALLIALADLGGLWPVMRATQALTDLADQAVDVALNAAVAHEIAKGKLPDCAVQRPAGGLVALAMGKMGGGELNYSSDIDLIMLYDGALYGTEAAEARPALVRATRGMVKTLSEITADGYVFRTDLRLRPDAAVTPVALSLDAAESYYESVGRTWERAAYIKARPAAGDLEAGAGFLKRLGPFVWRKHLDFAAIQDAHDMRLRIRAHKGLHGAITLPGHNMKLGRGGIREIEFFTQTRQLIAGGRDPDLRCRGTLDGLAVLASKGWVPAEVTEALSAAYLAHREVEHRLQMIGDAQTHDLPVDDPGFDRLAAFMGQEAGALRRELTERLEQVHALTESFFAPGETRAAPELPDRQQSLVRGWYSYPALRSSRAVEVFERLKPGLLERLGRAARPDEALEQFDLFLAGLPAGVQVFSLFEANPQLIDLIVDICVSPSLAQYLGRNAQVFDAVIGGSFFAPWPGAEALTEDLQGLLSEAGDYERVLDAARRWHKEWHFRIGVHFLRDLMTAEETGPAYADLAEAVLRALWPHVALEFSRKFGASPGAGAAILGMGSLGARMLSASSDLDLIVIYDAEGLEMSVGPRPLAARQYYARLTKAFVTALSAQTAEGALYEVDMRLRPSGRQGPVATSLTAFRSYQQEQAWTWEHLALTRARYVAGAEAVGASVEAVRAEVLQVGRDKAGVLKDVAEMRRRIAEASGQIAPLDAKRGPGRLQEIDLIAQAGAVITGALDRETPAQLAAGWGGELAGELSEIWRWLWAVHAAGRLLTGGAVTFDALGDGGQSFLLRQAGLPSGVADGAALVAALEDRSRVAADHVNAVLAGTEEGAG